MLVRLEAICPCYMCGVVWCGVVVWCVHPDLATVKLAWLWSDWYAEQNSQSRPSTS